MIKITKKLGDMGNSKYVVLPELIIRGWPQEVDLELYDDKIVIRPHPNGEPPGINLVPRLHGLVVVDHQHRKK